MERNLKFETRNLKSVFLTLLLTAGAVFGEATLKIEPPLIELSESATLSIEVRDVKSPQPPALPGVPGLNIRYSGQSTQHSWVNGKSDSFTAFNYQVYPQQTGTFTIGPFQYGSQTLRGELKVVAGSAQAQQAQSWSDLLFAKLETDRDNAYVQEPFTLTLSIYSRQGLQMAGNIGLNGMPQTGLPEFQWQEAQPGREVINGAIFDVRHFTARTRAMSSGVFDFKPSVTVPVVVPNQNRRSRSPFDDAFFGSMFQRTETRPVDVPVERVSVTVKPLPESGRPESFNGAVGRFALQTRAEPRQVQVGDPITLQLVIRGDGNFDRVMMPTLPVDDSLRLFGDPVRKQTDGAVVFEQVLSPRSADTTEIPSVAFSFFDTHRGQYRTVESAPIPITVKAVSNSTAQVFAAKENVVVPPPQDHAFATESDVQRAAQWFSKVWKKVRPWLWVVPALLLAWLAGFAGHKLFHSRRQDTARLRRQKAPKAARAALKQAEQAAKKNDAKAFHDALWQALTDYFGHRLNLPPGEVSPQRALSALSGAGFDPEQLNILRNLFEQIEASRYGLTSGSGNPERMKTMLGQTERILHLSQKMRL